MPTLLHRFSPDISFAPSSFALSCSWEVLQDLCSDHLPILLTVPLSSLFHPNEHLPSFNFETARGDDFAFYFDSHCPSAEKYSSFSHYSAAALFISLALNAAKIFIPLGHIKRQPQAWWSPELEEAVRLVLPLIQVMNIIRLATLLPDIPRISSPKPRLRHGRRHVHLSLLNLTLNLRILSFALSLALLPHFSPPLTSPIVPLPESRLRSSLTT